MKTYGYCRISRKTQSIERQLRNIKAAYPAAVILQEAYTGTKVEGRREFEKLLRIVRLSWIRVLSWSSLKSRTSIPLCIGKRQKSRSIRSKQAMQRQTS